MTTKTIQMEFQVAANDGVSALVTVSAAGQQVFSGQLDQTSNPLPGQIMPDDVPFSLVSFEIDVAEPAAGQIETPIDVVIAVSGGSITLQETETNYVSRIIPANPPTNSFASTIIPGDATTFYTCRFANQPVWTPPATGRLNYEDNLTTGPGSLLLLDGESCAYQEAVLFYVFATQ